MWVSLVWKFWDQNSDLALVKHLPLQAMIDLSVFTGYNDTFTNQRTNSFHIDEGGKTNQLSFDDLWFSNTTGILQKKTMWLIGVELEQEMSAPPPKKNPGSTPDSSTKLIKLKIFLHTFVLPLGSPMHCNSKER